MLVGHLLLRSYRHGLGARSHRDDSGGLDRDLLLHLDGLGWRV